MPFNLSVKTKATGPMFDHRAKAALDAFEEQLRVDVADQGAAEVGRETRVFKRPTGNYLRNIRTTRRLDSNVVDTDVIYDSWIEGTSSRNDHTRFKGYRVFRKATQSLERRVPEIARDTIKPYLRRMNG